MNRDVRNDEYWNPLARDGAMMRPRKIQDEELAKIDTMTCGQLFNYIELVLDASTVMISMYHRWLLTIHPDNVRSGPTASAGGENMMIAIVTKLQNRLKGEQKFIFRINSTVFFIYVSRKSEDFR